MTNEDWASIAETIALEVLGKPTKTYTNELRWGSKGSFCLNTETGQFKDFESSDGGGVAWFLKQHNIDVNETLERFGFSDAGKNRYQTSPHVSASHPLSGVVDSKTAYLPSKEKSATPLSTEKLRQLWQEAEIKVKYSDNFIVLRFPEGHPGASQKYTPYCKQSDNTWIKKRPTGDLPLYLTPGRDTSKPVLLTEGEKAATYAEKLWDGQVACHHGGVTGWRKTDWSPLFGRKVYIYPDNDEPGFKFAEEISKYLRTNKSHVYIAKPHEDLAEKEDLYEAWAKNLYINSLELESYIVANPMPRPKGSFYAMRAAEVIQQVDNPKWLIDGVFEEESLISVFGAPKSGKSFVSLQMAVCIATGQSYFGTPVKRGSVLYVAGEGLRGIRKRTSVLSDVYDVKNSDLYITNRTIKVNDDAEYEKLVDEMKLIEAECGKLNLVVLDTFQRTFQGNENSAEDVGYFISKCDEIISDFGCAVMIVHHTGHGNGDRARGSSVIGASLDYEFKVNRDDQGDIMYVNLHQTLNKDGMNSFDQNYEIEDHSVNVNGLLINSARLKESNYVFNKKKEELTALQTRVFAAFEAEHAITRTQKEIAEVEVFLQSSDFKDRVRGDKKDSDGEYKYLTTNAVKKHLEALVKRKKLWHLPGYGFQLFECKAISPYKDFLKEKVEEKVVEGGMKVAEGGNH